MGRSHRAVVFSGQKSYPAMAYSAEGAADWIVTEFTNHLGQDLGTLKSMIAADLRYAYQHGRQNSLASAATIEVNRQKLDQREVTDMKKLEMAEEIEKQAGLTNRQAVEALESVLVLIKSSLQGGEDVSISGFGKFTVRRKRARQGRNPHTGEPVTITARRVLMFKSSALFKAYVNGESMPLQEPAEPPS